MGEARCGGSEEIRFNRSPNNDPQWEESYPCHGCPDCFDREAASLEDLLAELDEAHAKLKEDE